MDIIKLGDNIVILKNVKGDPIMSKGINSRKVAVIGTGFVGSSSAFALMESGLFTEMVLIDADKNRAEGEALDIAHGLPFARPMKITAGDYDDIVDAAIIVVTAGAGQKPGETRLDLVKKNVAIFQSIIPEIAQRKCEGILLIVANPVDILTQVAVKLSGFPENRVFGSGTTLDSARLKYLLGEHLQVDARSVHAWIIGEHGDSEIVAWSSANVSGVPISEFCEMRGYTEHDEHMEEIAQGVKNSAYKIIEKKKEIQDLNWNYKDGLLYATNRNHKRCINGTAQYYMKNSKLINTMENSGYKGIKKWMEQCEKDTAGIKVKAGDKTYLFHNTDKWHTFKKNGLTCLYNYKRFIIRFDFNKVIGLRSNLSDLPQSGREMWTAISDHSGSAANEVILRSYNDEELYARKNVQIFLQDHKIKQMLIYWDETEAFKGFTKEEKIFLKGCFEKMGISSKDAQEWLNTFMIKKTPQSGKLGSWTYSKGNSKNQVISLINHNENNNYVNFYKKSKGNN